MLEVGASQTQMTTILDHLISGPLRLVEELDQAIFRIRFQ